MPRVTITNISGLKFTVPGANLSPFAARERRTVSFNEIQLAKARAGLIAAEAAGAITYTVASEDSTVPDALEVPTQDRVGEVEGNLYAGGSACWHLVLSAQPSSGDTIGVGGDVYEFLDAGDYPADEGNIAVLIGANAAATRTNLVAAVNATFTGGRHTSLFLNGDEEQYALANGTENVVAEVSGNNVLFHSADAPGGSIVAANPSIVLAESITDAADKWNVGNVNVNTLSGRAASTLPVTAISVTVTAAMVTNGFRFGFPFAVGGFFMACRTSAGLVRAIAGSDAYSASGNDVAVTFNGGASPNVQATDILTCVAWP